MDFENGIVRSFHCTRVKERRQTAGIIDVLAC